MPVERIKVVNILPSGPKGPPVIKLEPEALKFKRETFPPVTPLTYNPNTLPIVQFQAECHPHALHILPSFIT